MSQYVELEALVDTFRRDIEIAKGVVSPNPEDDLVVRAAIVGFSYNAETSDWAKQHLECLRLRLERQWEGTDLRKYGPNAGNLKLFSALCIGYLLGLYQRERITDREFAVGEAQISAIIMLHLTRLTAGGNVGSV